MDKIPSVEIDNLGRFKYVQIKVLNPDTKETKTIIRGFTYANYHLEIAEHFERVLNAMKTNKQIPANFVHSILGGGRIYHNPDKSTIKVYGYSEAFGKADHELTANMIKEQNEYKNYEVTWSDDGY